MNKNQTLSLLVISFMAQPGGVLAQGVNSDVQYKPVSITSQFDEGQIVQGQVYSQEKILPGAELNGNFFQRTSVWITQQAVVKDRLSLTVGVGGLFWYALPADPGSPNTVLTQFGPGISQAQALYTFGNLNHPAATLQMGYFPYKYNPDAKNLGEFLLRSGTYPNYLISGGWNMISSAAYMVEGLRLNASGWDGRFQADFLLPMEHDVPPMYDFSPTLVATLKPVRGVEVGAGVDCNHCLAIKPSLESPHVDGNRVITGVTVTTDSSLATFDSTGHITSGQLEYDYNYKYDTTGKYYTFQGVKLMGRASFDPKAYVPLPMLGPEDLKLYAEMAVLGVQDYPYLYNDIFRRMPVMFGVNLPTFKLLDVLSFEMEYYHAKFPNSTLEPINSSLPLPDVVGAGGTSLAQSDINTYYSEVNGSDWKWSVYATREITQGFEIYAQAACDDIRTILFNGGPQPTYAPITNHNGKDWYYIVRFQFGI